ncbi:MAG TPA: GNAT family N-acetyltransferase [Candidatus Angelobacter sp.]|nr:GNAT family N-acetyltransferase [Candidatus Angelobacter sp.]
MPLPPLTTARLLLRQRHISDVPAILAMNTDPEVMRFVGDGRIPDPVELERRTRARVDTDFGLGLGYWSLFLRTRPDDYLGYVVLSPVPQSADIELSYGIRRDAWGHGLAAEGSRAALDFGFRQRGLPEIVALTYHANVRSQRVIAKLGFAPAGIRNAYGQDLLYFRLGRDAYLATA